MAKIILILLLFTQLAYSQRRDFDGDDYIDCGNDSTTQMTTQGTIALWTTKNTTTQGYDCLIGCMNFGTDRNGYGIMIQDNTDRILFSIADAAAVNHLGISDIIVDINVWYHIAGTWNGSRLSLYVNGVVNDTWMAQTVNANSGVYNLFIGQDGNGGFNYDGIIDEVAIYNRALSANEIVTLMSKGFPGQQDGLMGYWTLDEESLDTFDKSGNDNHGAVTGTVTGDNAPIKRIIGE